jgi:hypothetical protein
MTRLSRPTRARRDQRNPAEIWPSPLGWTERGVCLAVLWHANPDLVEATKEVSY